MSGFRAQGDWMNAFKVFRGPFWDVLCSQELDRNSKATCTLFPPTISGVGVQGLAFGV